MPMTLNNNKQAALDSVMELIKRGSLTIVSRDTSLHAPEVIGTDGINSRNRVITTIDTVSVTYRFTINQGVFDQELQDDFNAIANTINHDDVSIKEFVIEDVVKEYPDYDRGMMAHVANNTVDSGLITVNIRSSHREYLR